MKYKVTTDSVLIGILEGLGTTKHIRNSFKFFMALQAKQIFKKIPDET
jgi:hypothetical protein